MIALSILFGLIGFLLLFTTPSFGVLALIVGALFFLWGNRAKQQRREDARTAAIVEAMKNRE
jgi:chromate transport protein ChrA